MRRQTIFRPVMLALGGATLIALFLAGCTGGPGASPSPPAPRISAPAATPTAAQARTSPSALPSALPVLSTTYTNDDERLELLIRAGVDEAIPQLKQLNRTDPSKLVALFEPLGDWITAREGDVAAYTASTCTMDAVVLYIDGLDQFDDMRKRFMAWKDWGAHGHAFSPGAPAVAVATLEDALVALEAHCPG